MAAMKRTAVPLALLLVACSLAVGEGARSERPRGRKAAWSGDLDPSADAALQFVRNKLSEDNLEEGHLREQLSEATWRQKSLQKQLEDGQRAATAAEKKAQEALAKRAHQDAAVLALEKRHEAFLEGRLRNLSRAFALRGKGLEAARDSLVSARTERTRLRSALEAARRNSSSLAETLAKTEDGLAELRHQLVLSQQSAEAATHSWRETEAELKRERAAEKAEREDRARALKKEEEQVRLLREAGERSDAVLRDLKREAAGNAATLEARLAKEQAQAEDGQLRLQDERRQSEQQVGMLTQALKAYGGRLLEEQRQERALSQQLAALERNKREEEANFSSIARLGESQEQELQGEQSVLKAQLSANTSLVSQLKAEVALLRERVQDGDAARHRAEAGQRRAEEGMERAQAVARQLAGTVPRLLEQTQRAHEARDVEKALRARTQATVQHQLEQIRSQYASVVRKEIQEASTTTPSPEGNATEAWDLLTQQAGGLGPADEGDDAGDGAAAVPLDDVAESRLSDLSPADGPTDGLLPVEG